MQEKERTVSDKIDESYGYEEPLEEEDSDKSIAQQMIEAIKAKRDGMFKKGKKVGV
jgi:hypothetical protein